MLNFPDPLLAQADIVVVAAETGLSLEVVERIHGHLCELHGEPPSRAELRAYTAEVGESLGEGGLRLFFGMPPDPARPAGLRADRVLEVVAQADAARPVVVPPPPGRRRGRPKGTRSASREQIVDASRALRSANGKRPTQAQLAANLDPPVGHRTLQAWLREYGLPWPIE